MAPSERASERSLPPPSESDQSEQLAAATGNYAADIEHIFRFQMKEGVDGNLACVRLELRASAY